MIGNVSSAVVEKPRKRKRHVQIRCPIGVEHAWVVPKQLHVNDEDARETFHMFDRRRVGFFTEKDIRRVFGGSGPHFLEFLDRFDANRDGKVEFDEFRETLADFVKEKGDLNLFERIYVVFSEPSSCILARWFSLIIMALIIISTASFVLDTMPSLKVRQWSTSCCGINQGFLESFEKHNFQPTPSPTTLAVLREDCPCEPQSPQIFYSIELICIVVFTFEYILRLLTVGASRFGPDFELVLDVVSVNRDEKCPPLKRIGTFLTNTMNVIDLLAILPFYISLLEQSNGGNGSGLGFLRVLRLARVFRVFKMGKYNKGMQLFSKVMLHSAPALKLLCFFTLIGMILFGSLIYFFERGTFVTTDDYPDGVYMRPDVTGLRLSVSPFTSIPACFWWVITTQTTVGYGDSYPTSDTGKVIGSLCMITGVLVLALPITIIGANFANEYAKVQADEARERHLEAARRSQEEAEQKKLEQEAKLEEKSLTSKSLIAQNQVIQMANSRVKTTHEAIHPMDCSAQESSEELELGGSSNKYQEQGENSEDDESPQETDLEIVEIAMGQKSSELVGMIRDYIEAERLTKLAGDCMLTEINYVMHVFQEKDIMFVPPERVQGMLLVAWHWISRCEKDDTVVLFQDDKHKLLRQFMEFATSTLRPSSPLAPF